MAPNLSCLQGIKIMAAKQKIDGVVEAVRYTPEGMIALVRLYPRIATTFADRVLMTREQLVEALRAKKHFVTGQRRPMWGATFDSGADIQLNSSNGQEFVFCGQAGGHNDQLQGVPRF
jgi:hypothetical protein